MKNLWMINRKEENRIEIGKFKINYIYLKKIYITHLKLKGFKDLCKN